MIGLVLLFWLRCRLSNGHRRTFMPTELISAFVAIRKLHFCATHVWNVDALWSRNAVRRIVSKQSPILCVCVCLCAGIINANRVRLAELRVFLLLLLRRSKIINGIDSISSNRRHSPIWECRWRCAWIWSKENKWITDVVFANKMQNTAFGRLVFAFLSAWVDSALTRTRIDCIRTPAARMC